MGRLDGRVALVTGAAVGIGREIAIAYAREGALVVVNYSRSRAEAEQTAGRVEAAGGEALLVRADVTDDGAVRSMVDQALDRWGRIDLLVNNAGVTNRLPFADLEALTDEVWDRLYAVNVKGAFFCARAVAEPMRRQAAASPEGSGGRIVNIASVAGIRPTGSSIAYCASKAALIHVSQCLAKALAPQIRVNVIAPGFVDDTRWNEGVADLETLRAAAARGAVLGRTGRARDIAEVALFLATGGDFMTGAVIVVDGGRQFNQ
jgi:3-oxoacyl-[acyl-carrier protein] reductase